MMKLHSLFVLHLHPKEENCGYQKFIYLLNFKISRDAHINEIIQCFSLFW